MRWTYVLLVWLTGSAPVLAQVAPGATPAQTDPPGVIEQPTGQQTAGGSSTGSSSQSPVFRGTVDLVALTVVVTNQDQQFVTGLAATDFAVFEDGVKQHLTFFGTADIPLDLAMLLDTSASMTLQMPELQETAIGFASTLHGGDRAMVVDIKDNTTILQPLTSDPSKAVAAIRSTVARGGTGLYNGLYLTLKELVKERRAAAEVRRQAIVVVSDGTDTASLVSFDDVMEVAKRSGIAIYTIALHSKYDQDALSSAGHRYFSEADFTMRALAQATGASAFFPGDTRELSGVYRSIAEELGTQYSLGYTSTNQRRDGRFRRVVVQVSDVPGGRTRTREGYVAATPTTADAR